MRVILFLIGLGLVIQLTWPSTAPTPAPVVQASVPVTPGNGSTPAPPPPAFGETVLLRDASGHFFADADVNYGRVRFLVDTGASTIALTEADARAVGIMVDPTQYRVVGRGASGDAWGQTIMIDSIAIDGKRATGLSGVVLRDGDVSLLGQSFLSRIGSVSIEADRMTLR